MHSNSSLETFRRCATEYFFRYILLRKGRGKAAALRFGSLFHLALNAWWRCNGDAFARLDAAFDAINAAAFADEFDEFDLVKARCLIAGYTARWGAEEYESIGVELEFRLPIDDPEARESEIDPCDLGGSIDVVARHRRERVRNVEHKTTSSDISIGSNYWRHVVALDPQVSTYMNAARALGFDPVDTLYDVIRKPSILPLLATPEESKKYTKPTKSDPTPRLYANQREHDETPEEYGERLTEDIAKNPSRYFARMPIVRLPEDDAAHARDVVGTVRLIQFAKREDVYPRSPGACERYGRLCEYHDVCSGITTIDDDSRFETNERKDIAP